MKTNNKFNIIIPTYNDFDSLFEVIKEIDSIVYKNNQSLELRVIIVDDGSKIKIEEIKFTEFNCVKINYIKLSSNLGHQIAIYIGMKFSMKNYKNHNLIIMDGDGEDQPKDVIELISQNLKDQNKILVAKRTKRTNGYIYKTMYFFYKLLFFIMTGNKLNFGNFCLIPHKYLSAITNFNSIKRSLAATILKSKFPISRIDIQKGNRIYGKSKVNFEYALKHGLEAMSVFSQEIIIRVILFSSVIFFILTSVAVLIFYLRFFTNVLIPGQATYSLGFLITVNLIIFANSLLLSFIYSGTNSENNLNLNFNDYINFEKEIKK